MSSTLASLGIGTGTHPGTGGRPHLRLVAAHDHFVGDDDQGSVTDWAEHGVDEYVGYAEPVSCTPRELVVGDLIEVDEGSGIWVVVDEAPEDDVVDPGMVAVSWRGDGDESGSLALADDTTVPVRRPEEDFA